MTTLGSYEVFAIRYAHHDGTRGSRFLDPVDDPDASMPISSFVWVVRNGERTVLVDTGVKPETGERRGRPCLIRPLDGLLAAGVAADSISDVVVSHGHWDHTGTVDDCPAARVHLQAAEMAWITGGAVAEAYRHSYEGSDVTELVRRLYDGRLILHAGPVELAPGLSLHHLGGHTPGMQVVRVLTARGWLVLASDASHYYENMETEKPFAVTYNRADSVAGYRTLYELAESRQHVIPGHDPLVTARYPALAPGLEGVAIRLDVAPSS